MSQCCYPPEHDIKVELSADYIQAILHQALKRIDKLEQLYTKTISEWIVRCRELEWAHEIKEDSPDETKRNVTKDAQEAGHEHIMQRINRLESLTDIANYKVFIDDFNIRVSKLEKLSFGGHALDRCAADVLERLTKLETYMNMEDRATASDVLLRLNELEKKREMVIDLESFAFAFNDTCDKIYKRIEDLENGAIKRIGILGNALADVSTKKPHACPVCHGQTGYDLQSLEEVMANEGKTFKYCKACDGEGVLWG